jgi:hypothetical protein
MEERPDILHFLKTHSTPPPKEIEERILGLPQQDLADRFRRLREHTAMPPRDLADAIRSRTGGRTRVRMLALSIAAAVLAIVAGVFLFRFQTGRRQSGSYETAGRSRKEQSEGKSAPGSDSLVLPASGHARSAALTSFRSLPLEFVLEGVRYPLTGNSLLTTFIGLRYPLLKKYLTSKAADNGWRIHLDAYTSVDLSGAMVSTLRKLYGTRADGSPARDAKRTLERLGKWSMQDSRQFDLRYASSPLDPVDLANFLFPPLFSFGRNTRQAMPAGVLHLPADTAHLQRMPAIKTNDLTVSYTLELASGRTGAGIGETYNGGMQTLFDGGHEARLRLATLMRIQSVFMNKETQVFTVVPESAKQQSPVTLTAGQWSGVNGKYVDATCSFTEDTVRVLGYPCTKAVIQLKNGRRITAWYTPSIQDSAQSLLEPAFTKIPGLVLRYEYTTRRKTVRYIAVKISRQPIDPSVFVIPSME